MKDELQLYIPRAEDGWFYCKMLSDPETMAYNAPWFPPDGCIPAPEEEWRKMQASWIGKEPERFYAFLQRKSDGAFVGDVNHHYNPEQSWWEGFYSESTDINLSKILNGEDQEGYDLLIRDIDALANYLKELDDYHVPILWRPLHEGGGDPKWNNPWFWWGSSGAEAYKELWKLMYDRLTNYHEINNLIWVWNGQNLDYYPGDEYVDIVGYDVYADAGDYSSKKWYYDYTKDAPSENKIVAMTENGTLFDPDAAMNDGTRWSYFATWNGEFTIKDMQLSEEYTSFDMWEKIYKHDRVLTLSELPDLKSYPLDTQKYLEEHPDEAPKE